MSDDLIRRSDAIKAIEAEECLGYVECRTERLINQIRTIETIKPKRGEWQYVYKGQWVFRRCSCCEWAQTYDDSKYMGYRYNFCPNCGADMRGKDDE